MTATTPVFVVVGNVNQGKSSIVASLAEDATVPIDPAPGTTVRAGEYHFKVGDRVLFTLVDTPGFQDARYALAWLRERSRSPTDRPSTVAAFVAAHESSDRFQDEVRLLRPILAGASILYVVDTSGPPQPSNEAEMEVLRWTGQPRMALLNRTRDRDHAAEWRPYLEQYFNIVRTFDAHHAGFPDRRNLLRSFREVRDDWRGTMDEALAVLDREWTTRRQRAGALIAELMVGALSHVERKRLDTEEPEPWVQRDLQKAFESAQRKLEEKERAEVERLYRHGRVDRREGVLEIHDADLFSDLSWRFFGLTRAQLAQYGVAWGAALGAAIDLMVGGLSFFAGAAIGALTGGLAGFLGGTQIARTWGERSRLAKLLFPGETGRFLGQGPVTNPRYAWMLLDRALAHVRAVRERSHARQDALDLVGGDAAPASGAAVAAAPRPGVVAGLRPDLRDALDGLLRQVLRQALRGPVSAPVREQLSATVQEVLRWMEEVPPGSRD